MARLIAKPEDHTDKEREYLREVQQSMERDKKFRKPYEARWETYGGLYRSVRNLRQQYGTANDRDVIVDAALQEWPPNLFIPLIFGTIETVVPQALSNDPRMLPVPKPGASDSAEAVEAVKAKYAEDQANIDYELKLQDAFKSGEVFGLGVGKSYWRTDKKKVRYNEKRLIRKGYKGSEKEVTCFDGPMVEHVDIWDFFWDPAASDIDTCGHVIHRIYRPFSYVKQMVESGKWLPLDLDEVKRMAPDTSMGDSRKSVMESQGFSDYSTDVGQMHEIWEYHTKEKVCTVLNGKLLVQEDINPAYHNELPFQIFRPTRGPNKEFVGIGLAEQLEHLQYELNALRSQRRAAAILALQMPIAYQRGMVDPEEIILGPAMTIETLTAPSEALYPVKMPDLPQSGFQEADEIKADANFTTGVSDPVAGGTSDSPSTSTATGFQLTVAQATRRIQLHTKNLEREFIRHAARQWKVLYGQHILESAPVLTRDAEGNPAYTEAGPEHFAAIKDVVPDAGSTLAENDAQKVQNATAMFNLLNGHENIDPQKLLEFVLKANGVPDPQAWIRNGGQQILQQAAKAFLGEGIPQEQVIAAVQNFMAVLSQPAQEQPPSSEQQQTNGAVPEQATA